MQEATTPHSPYFLRRIDYFNLQNRRVFLRADLNVPLEKNERTQEITIRDDTRIRAAIPTIQYALSKGAKLILASHLGKPEGTPHPSLSLEPVAHRLAELLDVEILLGDKCFGDGIELMAQSLNPGSILLLENLRFNPQELTCEAVFSKSLSKFTQVFINDAFGSAHRKHASIVGLPSLISERGTGFLFEQEITLLETLRTSPERPFVAIIGGNKVADKIIHLTHLLKRTDYLCIGGALAHVFWAAQGKSSQGIAVDLNEINAANHILEELKRDPRKKPEILCIAQDTQEGKDIGPKTIEAFSQVIKQAQTVFWNGPLGCYEQPQFMQGTSAIANVLAPLQCQKIIAGADTVAAIKALKLEASFKISTGGTAAVTYLADGVLAGLESLRYSSFREKGAIVS
jgi:phosphoglycerate kinase